jgi:hypothetical protein
MTVDPIQDRSVGKGWRRALVLLVLLTLTSVFPAGVLVSVPFLVLVVFAGVRGVALAGVTALAMVLALSGVRDPLWYVERGWAVVLGGFFTGITLAFPAWRLTTRSLAAVGGSVISVSVFFVLRSGAWLEIDMSVAERLQASVGTLLDAMTVLRQGEAVPPALVNAVYRTIELQAAVFPAMVALESLGALALAWWLFVRLVHKADDGVGPVARFRFNDHLVWLMIAALVIVVAGQGAARLGANLAVFMGTLYAVRGLAVMVAVSGGLSFIGYSMFTLGILVAAPFVLGFMAVLGIADTWLDLRARAGSLAQ